MATGGTSEEHPNTCSICLDTSRLLKFLPCHHSFCGQCTHDVAARHPGGNFPCPVCRRKTSLPPGGVCSLQTNFYTQPQTPQKKPGKQNMCKIHDEKKLEFYCVKCDKAICLNCKLTKHEGHETDDLTSATFRKQKELQTHRERLQNAVSDVIQTVTSLQEEKQSLEQKRAAVEKDIHRRYNVVVAAAAADRDQKLSSLQSKHNDLQQDIDRVLHQKEDHKAQLSSLLRQANDAITAGTPSDVITVAKEMRSGSGSQSTVDAITSREERSLLRPVVQSDVSADVMVETIRDYMGSVGTTSTAMMGRRSEVKVTECFDCGEDPDTEICSLCHEYSNTPRVIVSFERCGLKKDAPVKGFTETGQCVFTGAGDDVGKVSYKRYAEGKNMRPTPPSGVFVTFCKSAAEHFRLGNTLSGKAQIQRVTVTCMAPFKSVNKIEFTIHVGLHRAFDADITGQYFVVVEEGKESTARRSVLLYQRPKEKPINCYRPPTAQFQPSDVCFYTLGGRIVLLITDEFNDEIHVVSIRGRKMRFERYLCPGCPSLIQPTAITVDIHDRLWVACRGGAVLRMERSA